MTGIQTLPPGRPFPGQRGPFEQGAELARGRRLALAPDSPSGLRCETLAVNCPQHDIQLKYDRAEDGLEYYVCPVYCCSSKILVVVLQ
jgi:hypothetical protein